MSVGQSSDWGDVQDKKLCNVLSYKVVQKMCEQKHKSGVTQFDSPLLAGLVWWHHLYIKQLIIMLYDMFKVSFFQN